MNIFYIIFLTLLAGCKTLPPVEVEPEVPFDPVPVVQSIVDTAGGSACAKYRWKDRGVAPVGYIKGMALTYAKALCHPEHAHNKALSEDAGPVWRDMLANYGLKGGLLQTYTYLIGHGMRESSGKYCSGADASATNHSPETAEAGLLQTSYNVRTTVKKTADGTAIRPLQYIPTHPALTELIKGPVGNCFLEVFQEGVSASRCDGKNWGTGSGLKFQQDSKSCPAFAVEVGAMGDRFVMSHYGPNLWKAVEYRQDCEDMLSTVQKIIESNPKVCEAL